MTQLEFEKKPNSLPVKAPDEIDCAVHAEAEKINDGTTATLEEFQRSSTRNEKTVKVKCRLSADSAFVPGQEVQLNLDTL